MQAAAAAICRAEVTTAPAGGGGAGGAGGGACRGGDGLANVCGRPEEGDTASEARQGLCAQQANRAHELRVLKTWACAGSRLEVR